MEGFWKKSFSPYHTQKCSATLSYGSPACLLHFCCMLCGDDVTRLVCTYTHTHSLNPSRSLEDYKTFHCLFLHPYPCLPPLLFITTSVFMFWMQPLLDFNLHFLCSEMKSVLILQNLSLFLKVLYVWGSLHNHLVAFMAGVNFALFFFMKLSCMKEKWDYSIDGWLLKNK